jgi:hypothetical protein
LAENCVQHASLRDHSLGWHALRIEIQSRLNLGVPQQFLNSFRIGAAGDQKRRKRMAEVDETSGT